ncbi:MAG: hypothetical protein RBS46_12260 [Methyloversatilis sp.]|jgi:hypothetical protein|nr:hypothetical protein [Methyloversatilis sp.]
MKRISLLVWVLSYQIEERRQRAAEGAELLTEAACCMALAILRGPLK